MSDNRIIILAVVAGGAYLLMNKARAAAPAVPAGQQLVKPTQGVITNFNGDLWGSLIGNTLGALVNPSTGKSLLGLNGFGQWVSSDGKPVSSTITDAIGKDLGVSDEIDYVGGTNYLDALFPTFDGTGYQ
jgi:hypothetical protein